MTDLLIFEEYKFCSNGSKKSPRPHKDESSWYHLNSESSKKFFLAQAVTQDGKPTKSN